MFFKSKITFIFLTICFFSITFLNVSVFGRIEYHTKPTQRYSRATLFEPQVISKTCLLEPDPGPCRGNINMYYFNPSQKSCSTFRWGGCQGNGNRFDTEKECNSTCVSTPDYRTPRPQYCSLRFDYGYCFGAVSRWYYDPMWKVCKETIFSGCGGNKNNFYNLANCETYCRFSNKLRISKERPSEDMNKQLIINHPNATTKQTTTRVFITDQKTGTTALDGGTKPNMAIGR